MRVALLSLFVVVFSLSAEARPGRGGFVGDFDFFRPGLQSCSAVLEKKVWTGGWDHQYRYEVVETFTEFGHDACFEAEFRCDSEMRRLTGGWGNHSEYRCTVQRPVDPRPTPVKSCSYQVEVGRRGSRRLIGQPFHARGFNACEFAQNECEDELYFLRRQGRVGPYATCVKVSGRRPDPRPPVSYTRTCTAELIAGRAGRPTGNIFTGTATARSSQEAQQRACNDALSQCSRHERGSLRCVVK